MADSRLLVTSALMALSAAALPGVAYAQDVTIAATARVVPRPLTVLDIARSAVPGELRVLFSGGGRGTVTIEARTVDARVYRAARADLDPTTDGRRRAVTLRLSGDDAQVREYLLTLEQSDAVLAPAVVQIMIPAASLRTSARVALSL